MYGEPRKRRGPGPAAAMDRATEALVRLNRAMMRTFRREAAAEGVSVPQFLLLGWLLRCGEVPSTAFAERIGTSPSTVSGLVDGLVRAGWVERTHATEDRRKVLVRLTPAGRTLIERLETRRRAHLNRLFEAMDGPAMARALRVLEALATGAEAAETRGKVPTGSVPTRRSLVRGRGAHG